MTHKISLSLGFRVGKTRGGGQLFPGEYFLGATHELVKVWCQARSGEPFVCTSSFHGRILSCIGTSPPSWAIFPFMSTSFLSYAHLRFQSTSSPSRAHLSLYGHIFPFLTFFRVMVASYPAWAENHLHATWGVKNTEGGNLWACPKP